VKCKKTGFVDYGMTIDYMNITLFFHSVLTLLPVFEYE